MQSKIVQYSTNLVLVSLVQITVRITVVVRDHQVAGTDLIQILANIKIRLHNRKTNLLNKTNSRKETSTHKTNNKQYRMLTVVNLHKPCQHYRGQ